MDVLVFRIDVKIVFGRNDDCNWCIWIDENMVGVIFGIIYLWNKNFRKVDVKIKFY